MITYEGISIKSVSPSQVTYWLAVIDLGDLPGSLLRVIMGSSGVPQGRQKGGYGLNTDTLVHEIIAFVPK